MRLLSINFNSKEAKYITLYNYIKNAITDGLMEPNEKLPSKRVMAEHLQVSINTVMDAYNLLIDEGFIISIPKKGYYTVPYNLKVSDKGSVIEDISISNDIIYDFSTKNIDSNIFPYYTFNKISKDVIYNEDILLRSPSFGNVSLRNTIKKYLYETKGINVNPNNIIIGSGIEYLLTNLIDILPQSSIAIENPGYDKIKKLFTNNHRQIELRELDNEGIRIDNIKSDVVYITPSNEFPTGIKMSMKRKSEIAKWAEGEKYIIEDDFDSEFKYLSNKSLSLYDLNKEHTIILQTYSRSLSPSFRIAYMILPDSLINKYKEKFSFYSSTVSTLDQLILKKFIESGAYSRNINKNKALYKEKRELIIKLLCDYDFINIDYNNSYLSLIVEIKNINKEKFKYLIKQNKIDISLMEDYYMDKRSDDRLIIGYSGISIDLIEDGIKKLIEIIKDSLS